MVECDVVYQTSKHYARVFGRFVCLIVLLTLGNFNISKNLNSTREYTHLPHKGKYHCTADLLFDWFGFSGFVIFKSFTCWASFVK